MSPRHRGRDFASGRAGKRLPVIVRAKFASLLFACVCAPAHAAGTASASFAIPSDALNSGLDAQASTSYRLNSSLGDAFFGARVSSTSFALGPGLIDQIDIPVAQVSPTSLNFASQALGTTSAAQVVTITNAGAAPLALSSIAINGDFGQTGTCTAALGAGANCSFSVTFTPTVAGTRNGSLSFAANAGGSPFSVALAGTGSSGGGGVQNSGTGDVPLPPWAYFVMAAGLLFSVHRTARRGRL